MKIPLRRVLPPCAALLCLGASGILYAAAGGLGSAQQSQFAAQRWETGDSPPYTQVSVFCGEEMNGGELASLRESIADAMTAASLESREGARLWYDAASSSQTSMHVNGTRQGDSTAAAMAVDGDFFLLRSWQMCSGSPIAPDDLMQDRVVLDEKLSWQLFGSPNGAGMTVTVDGIPCVVAGVVEIPDTYAEKAAYGEAPRLYMSYALYETITGEAPMTACYEAVLPNPVRGFGEKSVTDSLGAKEDREILQNTGRYSLLRSLENIKDIHSFVLQGDCLYPFWEKAARVVEFDRTLLLIAALLLLIYPVVYLLRLIAAGYRKANRFITERIQKKRGYTSVLQKKGDLL